jgi:HK97 family phage portal protein
MGLRVRDPLSGFARAVNRAPVPFVGAGDSGVGRRWWEPATDRTSQMEAYNAVGTLHQVVHTLSEDTSRVDWHMHRKRVRSSSRASKCELCTQDNVDLLEEHPALTRWSKPNDFTTGQEFVEGQQQHIELTGEGYWVLDIVQAGMFGGPVEMWYCRPDRMSPVKSRTKFMLGWVYSGPDGEQVPLELNQVIQLKAPDPLDIYRGSGAVQTLLNDIRASVNSASFTEKFFENSAQPGGVIEVPAELEDHQWKRLTRQWREQHKGVSNAHRVAILENGMKWVDRSYSPKDLILTDLRKFSADQIREAFGFPEFASGKLENANRAASEASAAWYTQRLIVPRLDKIKDALNYRYLPLWGVTGNNVEFAYNNPVPPDEEMNIKKQDSQVDRYCKLVDSGVHPEDAAEICGLPQMRVHKEEVPV